MKESETKSKRAATKQKAFFVPATEDWCGKELFENKEVREGFLSDILKLPRSAIRDTEMLNPGLWKRSRKEKQGIVDIRIRLNNDRLINIEIQVIRCDYWDRRQLYYLSRMYAENARRGEDYDNLPDCISIAILDFNLTDGEDYYHCYKLRDEKGRLFSSALSIYILELKKSLGRETELDDWVRLFRAKSEEDLDMIKTKNKGILEAIRELKTIGLSNLLREEYELRLKAKRDARARDSYVRKEGIAIGKAEGKAEDILELLAELGAVPEDLRQRILEEKNPDILTTWLKAAAKAESVEEFTRNMIS